jgi:uncharacterized protein YwgA
MTEPSHGRTPNEWLIDKLLLLYLLNKYKINGRTKLQKTVFFSEDSLNDKKIKAFNYNFIRWHYGEFSRELEADFKELIDNGLILEGKHIIKVTDQGQEILKQVEMIIKKNPDIIRLINAICEYTSKKPLDVVKTMAYTKIMRNGVQVKDIREGVVLLNKLKESEAKSVFSIDQDWVDTLDILFNKEFSNSLRIAIAEKANIEFAV